MRASSAIKCSSFVVALALASGCSPADDTPAVAEAPEPPARELRPAFEVRPVPPQLTFGEPLRQVEVVRGPPDDSVDGLGPQSWRRLVFQCTDDVTFAVRMAGDKLEVFPPGYTLGYIVFNRQPSASGVLYARRGAEFRSNGELATLVLGNERYVDCVSNPAATVWESEPRPGATTR